jgi:Uri superfamily endonuclease
MTAGFAEFEFDLPSALLESLIRVFDITSSAPLDAVHVNAIPDAQGVYQLFLGGELVYVGKTDAEAGMRKRLRRHVDKISHRIGLEPSEVSFKAIRIFVFTAVDLEAQLIRALGKPNWNGSGFGSNDVGQNRDDTEYKDKHFDYMFPIDIDRKISNYSGTDAPTAEYFINHFRLLVPYTVRIESRPDKKTTIHSDFLRHIDADLSVNTMRGALISVINQLPAGWQATLLPSHVILYKILKSYKSGSVIWRSE